MFLQKLSRLKYIAIIKCYDMNLNYKITVFIIDMNIFFKYKFRLKPKKKKRY